MRAEMSVPARLAIFVAILAVALLGAYGIGRAVGPIGTSDKHDAPSHASSHVAASWSGHPEGIEHSHD